MTEQIDQLTADRLERLPKRALLHRARAGQRPLGRRVEQVEQPLRLGERKLVVKKRALRELTRTRHPRATREAGAEDIFHEVRISVARNLDHFLPGEGMGRSPKSQHDIVEHATLLDQRAVKNLARFPVDRLCDQPVDDGAAGRTAEANHRQRRDARRRAGRDDGLGGHAPFAQSNAAKGSPCASATAAQVSRFSCTFTPSASPAWRRHASSRP